MISTEPMTAAEKLIPIEMDGRVLYVVAHDLDGSQGAGDEVEIASRRPTLDGVLDGVKVFAREAVDKLREAEATRITVEFGCEFVVESGSLVAVIGKAGTRSAIKVSLEWSKPIP